MKTNTTIRLSWLCLVFLMILNLQKAEACSVNAGLTYTDSSGFFIINNTSSGYNRYYIDYGKDAQIHYHGARSYVYFTSPGIHTIVLHAIDSTISNCEDTAMAQLSTSGICFLESDFTSSHAGSSREINFYNFSTYGKSGDLTIWKFGDGDTSALHSPSHKYSVADTYRVVMYIYNTALSGCVDSTVKMVIARDCNVSADFTFTENNLQMTFTNTSSNAGSYTWIFGDGGSSTLTNPNYSYSTYKKYFVTLIAKSSTGIQCSESITKQVTALSCKVRPSAYESNYQPTIPKKNFTNSSSYANIYRWDFGDGASSTLKTPSHTYSTEGTYTVRLIATDTNLTGCSDTFYIYNVKYYNCAINNTSFTVRDSLGFITVNSNVSGSGFINYWMVYDDNGMDSFRSDGFLRRYTNCSPVTIVLRSIDSLSNCNAYSDTIIYPEIIKAHFDVVADTSNNYSGLIIDRSVLGPNTSYFWDFGDGDSSTSDTPVHTYSGPGPYLLCLTITDSNCTSTYCDSIQFDSSGQLKRSFKAFTLKVQREGGSTSLREVEAGQVKIYPNPFGSVIHLEGDQNMTKVRLYSSDGRVITEQAQNSRKAELSGLELGSGVYLIEVEFENGQKLYQKILH